MNRPELRRAGAELTGRIGLPAGRERRRRGGCGGDRVGLLQLAVAKVDGCGGDRRRRAVAGQGAGPPADQREQRSSGRNG